MGTGLGGLIGALLGYLLGDIGALGLALSLGFASGAMVPLLSLGIPGSATAAVLIGALQIHDITPGPELFTKQPDLVYTLFAAMFVANAVMAFIGVVGTKGFARLTSVLPKSILYPMIVSFSILGSYAVERSIVHVVLCLAFGLLGWLMKKYKYPASPVVLGVVLGKLMEENLSRALMVSGWSSFFTRPLTVILFLISIAAIVMPMITDARKKKAGTLSADAEEDVD